MMSKKMRMAMMSGLTALTLMAAPISASAATETAPMIKKTVTVADGVTIDSDVTFTIEQVDNADNITAPSKGYKKEDVTIATNGAKSTTGTYEARVALPANLPTDVGEYTYKVTENTTDLTTDEKGYGWAEKDENVFYLHVYVPAEGNTTYAVTAKNVADEKAKKLDDMAFNNTFTKRGNDNNNNEPSFTLSKKVAEGGYVDKDTEYEFTISFADSATYTVGSTKFAAKLNGTDTTPVGNGDTVKLKDNDVLTFPDIPAGVKVSVTEKMTTNQESVATSTISNGGTAVPGTTYEVRDVLIGEGANSITYTNTYKSITPTGIVTSIAPFAAMIAAAALAAVLYIGLKKLITR